MILMFLLFCFVLLFFVKQKLYVKQCKLYTLINMIHMHASSNAVTVVLIRSSIICALLLDQHVANMAMGQNPGTIWYPGEHPKNLLKRLQWDGWLHPQKGTLSRF